MRWHDRFEWEDRKAERNLRKHGVTFDQAAEVLADEAADRFHLEEYDAEHMNRKSHESRGVCRPVRRLRRSTPSELARLARMRDDPVDTSDIPERVGPCDRVVRDAGGKIVKPRQSPLRAAILAEVERRGISGHRLWKAARAYCDTLPESAVYEFLAGKRQLGLAYLDAILQAMDLRVHPR